MYEVPAIERIKIMPDNARIGRRDAGMRLGKAEHEGAEANVIDTLTKLENGLTERSFLKSSPTPTQQLSGQSLDEYKMQVAFDQGLNEAIF